MFVDERVDVCACMRAIYVFACIPVFTHLCVCVCVCRVHACVSISYLFVGERVDVLHVRGEEQVSEDGAGVVTHRHVLVEQSWTRGAHRIHQDLDRETTGEMTAFRYTANEVKRRQRPTHLRLKK